MVLNDRLCVRCMRIRLGLIVVRCGGVAADPVCVI